ncbi:methionyl-tRNA formyltransferase [Lutimonas vermicola]|uniref:Methionyl-tRNA formyltransferase n=1 Tax=Lutimonas vermicola TaxID=414288 RepID=A0ABU9KXK4_9FLAO
MKELRIIFMGTPDFAVATLKALVKEHYNVVAVITAPDKPAGRGRKLNQSAVKKYAMSNGLEVLQPANLKDPEFLEKLKSYHADIQVVVAFRMLPKLVWDMPKLGTFNLHASLLPDYRGAAPINWAIINGEHKTGVTTFFINEQIDTGAIIKQEVTNIPKDATAGELHDILMELGSRTVVETLQMIEQGKVQPIHQKEGEFNPAPKLNKEICRIQWNNPLEKVYNHIRGLSPYPGAWTILDNDGQQTEVKIYKANMIPEQHQLLPGSVVAAKKNLRVAVANGFLEITDLKMAGKRRMDAISLLNGYVFHRESKMF